MADPTDRSAPESPDNLEMMQSIIAQYGDPKAFGGPPADPSVDDEPETEPEDELIQALRLDSEPEKGADDEGEEDGAEQKPQYDLATIAKTLGLDETDLSVGEDGVRLKTKVDGEEGEVSLAELRKGYQLQKHFTKQQEQFLAERRQWEEARQKQAAELQGHVALATQVLQEEENQLREDYTLDWNTLRQEDPAEYAAKLAEYNQRLTGIRRRQQELTEKTQQQVQKMQQEQAAKLQEHLAVEQSKLSEALQWKDEKTRTEGAQRLQAYMTGVVGLAPEQLNTIYDHRAFVLAEKARRYDEAMAKLETAKKKVAEAPKVPTGGTAPPKATSQRRNVDQAMNRLRKDHSVESAAEVFRHLKVI